jgi:hypothetical protein
MPAALVLVVDGQSYPVRGRTAALIVALAAHQQRVNDAGAMGKVELNWTGKHVVPVLIESLGKHVMEAA